MKSIIIKLRVGCLFFFISAISQANTEQVEQALKLSGVDNLLNQSVFILNNLLVQQSQAPDINFDAFTKVRPVVKDAINKTKLKQFIINEFTKNGYEKRLLELVTYYQTPLAIRMSKLEKAMSAQDIKQALRQYPILDETIPRFSTVNRIDKLTGYSALFSEIRYQVLKSLNGAYSYVDSPDSGFSEESIDQRLMFDKRLLKQQTQQQVLSIMLYSYQTASEQELKNYLVLFEKEVFNWFYTISQQAIQDYFTSARETIYKNL